ncbi:MAG: transglycosylase domain-containing protein [Sporolactobacillus sp.]
MRTQLQRFSELFDRLAEFWAANPVIKTLDTVKNIIWHAFLIGLSALLIVCFFSFGTVSGYFAKLVEDQPVLSYHALKTAINNTTQSSVSYFAGDIPIGRLNSDLVRTTVGLDQISPYLIHGLIATEDELYYQHHGVVPKAVIRASIEELLHKPQVSGGSSITQQLVKNQILTNQVSLKRKFREILLAMRIEHFFSKKEILDSYLNMASFGRDASGKNIAGASAAAEGIFNVKASKLNIPQAAFIAGLPKNPFVYSPFQNQGGLKQDTSAGISRAHLVLGRMYATGYLTKKQYESAMHYDYRAHFATAKKGIADDYPYLTKEVESRSKTLLAEWLARKEGYSAEKLNTDYQHYNQIVYEKSHNLYGSKTLTAIAAVHHYNYSEITNHHALFSEMLSEAGQKLVTGGYQIYTTINKPIYDQMQSLATNYSGYSPDKVYSSGSKGAKIVDPMQVGAILIDNRTGRIISFVGGRGFDRSEYDYATEVTRQNGSTMKPLLVYAPAMELGLIQPGSIVADLPYKRLVNGKNYQPTDYGSTATSKLFHGFETARTALADSHNVPAVSTFTRLSAATRTAPDDLKKMGFSSLVGSDGYNVSAALGGITRGVTIEENTNAYTTFANGGDFVKDYMITKITDSSGQTIYRHRLQKTRVFTPQTSYLMLDMMRDVIKNGTARELPGLLKFNADWAGKTGTSQDWRDSWLVASNPNVTLGVWNGYAHNEQLNRYTYSAQTRQLWASFANSAYYNDPGLMAPKTSFKQPAGIVRTTYCGLTDQKPTAMCQAAGFVVTDLMNKKYLPTQEEEALDPADNGLFRIKPEVLQSRFPYLDLNDADPAQLGKIAK